MKPLVTHIKGGPNKIPNMRDVAAAAGVSLSTVSLVVNNRSGVSPKKRERVITAIQQLGYRSEAYTKDPSETKIFGLIMESLSEASRSEGFYTRIVSGIEDTAYSLGYQVLLHFFRPDVDPLNSIRELMGRDVSGMIIANDGDVTSDFIRKIAEAGKPLVIIENYQPETVNAVTADNFNAGRLMTEYLISLGHRRIGALGGPEKYSSLRDRMRGHQVALLEHGLPNDADLQPRPVSGHPRKGYLQMKGLLNLPNPPTAVFAVSDRAAIGAMEAIKEAHFRIPEDISIVGVDDVQEAAYTLPALTTYRVPKYDLGKTAVSILHTLVNNPETPPTRTVLLGNIAVRESAGPVPR